MTTAARDGITFEAALADGRNVISLNDAGQCVLVLEIPPQDAPKLVQRYQELLERTFDVTITL